MQAQEREGLSQQASCRWLFRPDKWVLAVRERCCWPGHGIYGDRGACRNGGRVVVRAGYRGARLQTLSGEGAGDPVARKLRRVPASVLVVGH